MACDELRAPHTMLTVTWVLYALLPVPSAVARIKKVTEPTVVVVNVTVLQGSAQPALSATPDEAMIEVASLSLSISYLVITQPVVVVHTGNDLS